MKKKIEENSQNDVTNFLRIAAGEDYEKVFGIRTTSCQFIGSLGILMVMDLFEKVLRFIEIY